METWRRTRCRCGAALLLSAAIAIGCEDEGDGTQQPPPVTPPEQTLDSVGLELVAENLTSPVLLIEAPDESGRLYLVDQVGVIRVIDREGGVLDTPFLDLRDRIVALMPEYDERGLLGLAFHPDFAANGRVFVYYTAPLRAGAPAGFDHTNVVSEFVDGTERILLEVDAPQFNHNGGMLAFGPDGYLYISIGDGGNANDVGLGHSDIGNAQDLEQLLGKVLRIDVDGTTPYAIPSDNPFANGDGRDEIYAYGFRNPFRFSFDMGGDRDLFLGDAGQDRIEEVDIVELGQNYGWNIKEGSSCFDPAAPKVPPAECTDVGANGETLVDPIVEYMNTAAGGIGVVVVGGFVYRGTALPSLVGDYVFGDFSKNLASPLGSVFAAHRDSAGAWKMRTLEIANGTLREYVRAFGQDSTGEIYLLTAGALGPSGTTGKVYRFIDKDAVPPEPVDLVAEQIAQGALQYADNCARCHGSDGMGTSLAPAIIGEGALPLDPPPERLLRKTQFSTAADVYMFVSTFMPFDAPGSLSAEAYLSIMAFVLDANGIELSQPVAVENAASIVIHEVP
jgi:glucose/arabinose dehydrogenase